MPPPQRFAADAGVHDGRPTADSPFPVPNLVTKDELQQAVSAHWDIDSIDPAFVYVQLPDVPNLPATVSRSTSVVG